MYEILMALILWEYHNLYVRQRTVLAEIDTELLPNDGDWADGVAQEI